MKDGSNTKEGYLYHDVEGVALPAQRPHSKRRADFICDVVNVKDRRVLDLGCNAGGIALQVAARGGNVVGVDYDAQALAVAMSQALKLGLQARFFNQTIDYQYFFEIKNLDIVLWLSQWQWFVKQYGFDVGLEALYILSRKCQTLVFESAASDGRAGISGSTQDDIYTWLIRNTCFSKIDRYKAVDDWNGRDIFVCSRPVVSWRRHRTVSLHRVDRTTVVKTDEAKTIGPVLKNGARILKKLKNEVHAPAFKLLHKNNLHMQYAGIPAIRVPERLTEQEVADILDMLKRHKIVHRDIKPDNLLFDGEHIVLIDYGWATVDGHGMDAPEALGEGYRSPRGFSDSYSLHKVYREFKFRSDINAY